MADIAKDYIIETKAAMELVSEYGEPKLKELSIRLEREYYEQQVSITGDIRVRLRATIETLLRGGSVTESDLMALAWYVSKQE